MTALLKHNELITALRGNAALMAKITALKDSVPDNQQSPYILVGDTTNNGIVDIENSSNEIYTYFHIWSNYKGRKEVLEINDLLKAALPDWCYYEAITVLQDSDEPTWWHGVVTIHYYD